MYSRFGSTNRLLISSNRINDIVKREGLELKAEEREIENLEKGGPIARADYYLLNNGSMEELKSQYDEFMKKYNFK